jgi:hypothetical protein
MTIKFQLEVKSQTWHGFHWISTYFPVHFLLTSRKANHPMQNKTAHKLRISATTNNIFTTCAIAFEQTQHEWYVRSYVGILNDKLCPLFSCCEFERVQLPTLPMTSGSSVNRLVRIRALYSPPLAV